MPTDRISGFNMGVSVKVACQVATTGANITLSGVQTIDGISVGSAAERVLVKDQTSSTNNGVYTADSSTWLRARDCDGNKDILPGSLVYVDRGAVNRRSFWVFNSSSTATSVVVGTDALTLAKVTGGLQGASSFIETSLFPSSDAGAARSAIGAFASTAISTWVETNFLTVSTRSSALDVLGLDPLVFNIKSYGAVGNSSLNSVADTSGLKLALQAVESAGRGVVYIPAGRFWINAASTCGGAALSLMGAGMGVSELLWPSTATSRGVAIAPSTARQTIAVRDIRFITAGTSGTALTITATGQMNSTGQTLDRVQPRARIDNCAFAGKTLVDTGGATADGWNIAINSIATIDVTVTGCNICGQSTSGFFGKPGTFGVRFAGLPDVGSADNGYPVVLIVEKTFINLVETGVAAYNCEGLFVNNSNIVVCNYGVLGYSTGINEDPQVTITNTHINSYNICVDIDGMSQSFVTGSLLYGGFGGSTNVSCVLVTQNSETSVIANNVFVSFSTSSVTGVNCDGSYCSITGNIFSGPNFINGIVLSTNSDHCIGSGNIFKNSSTFTNTILNSGSTTNVVT